MNSLISIKQKLVAETESILANVNKAIGEKIEGRGIILNDLYLQPASNVNVYLEFIPACYEAVETDNFGLHLNVIYDWVISGSGQDSLNIEIGIIRTDGETLLAPKEISLQLPADKSDYMPEVINLVQHELKDIHLTCVDLLIKQES